MHVVFLLFDHLLSQYSNQASRSEEHTSELQSQSNLVCRLLLEKKKKIEYVDHVYIRPVIISWIRSTLLRTRCSRDAVRTQQSHEQDPLSPSRHSCRDSQSAVA